VSSRASVAVSAAQAQLGVPYQFARSSPGVAFDCSGLTAYAWSQAGVSIPHQSASQFSSTPHVPQAQAQPGDLIFYYSPISHVGLYVGGGSMIHAPNTGSVVSYTAVHWDKVVGVTRPG
jgi:cell wall-associated NlpC family hydrolase